MKKLCLLLAIACLFSLFGCVKRPDTPPETQPTIHTHTFGEWAVSEAATCVKEGLEVRKCTGCEFTETRTLPVTAHDYGDGHICKTCWYVNLDPNADVVELGVICNEWYSKSAIANYAWDVKLWKGKLYRGLGDYDKNSGSVRVIAYNLATQTWETTGYIPDQAIHSFVEIGGELCTPGIDPTAGWDLGNYYILGDGKWKEQRNLANGIHNFKMVESNGRIFAGLGTPIIDQTVAVSTDGGKTFDFPPLYKDGKPLDISSYKSSRTYDFITNGDDVYALVSFQISFGNMTLLFRYEDGKMVYVANGYKLSAGSSFGRNYIGGNFDFNGACYVTSYHLYAITDFSDPDNYQVVEMPNKEPVADALVRDGVMYVLATKEIRNPSNHNIDGYKTVIYKSTTGEEGSFQEVVSFDYVSKPISFDFDGTYFYIGTGSSVEKAKTGMILRVKAPAGN